jgi:hypothetical protein
VTAYVLPSIAETDPAYVEDVIAGATGGTATGDIGALETINQVQGFAYLAGGFVFGIALIGLGYSLWSTARGDVPMQPAEVRDRRATTTGGEATV